MMGIGTGFISLKGYDLDTYSQANTLPNNDSDNYQ